MSAKTVRIDTLRNQVAATVDLLGTAGRVIDTLHDLAYDRQHADAELRVRGGQPDYALDRHGDPRARAALKDLAGAVDVSCQRLAVAAHQVVRIVNEADEEGTGSRRHPATVTLVEMVDLIEAQHRRIQRGEFDPGRTLPQSLGSKRPEAKLVHRIRQLEAELAVAKQPISRPQRRIRQLESDLAKRDRRIRQLEQELMERAT